MQMYNSGFAYIFDVPTTNARDMLENYIVVLKNILKLNYGSMCTPVILVRCELHSNTMHHKAYVV
jgi:hypothetical protein